MTPLTGHLSDAEAQRLVDGVLSAQESSALERHVAACAACQATVATYRALADALEDLEIPDLPTDFTDGVLARIESRERAIARERRHAAAILAGVVAAAAAAFAVAGASAWAPVVSSFAGLLGSALHALRIGADVVPGVLGALRFQIILGAGLVALPLLLALARLIPAHRAEAA